VTTLALALLLLAAVAHAGWNLIAKQAGDKLAFLWCSTLASAVLFLPLGAWLLLTQPVRPLGWPILAASACLEAAYFWSLAQAYRHGDLSLVYPVARGTAPLVVPLFAALFLGERPTLVAGLGIVAVVAGATLIHLSSFDRAALAELVDKARQPGTLYALLTGVLIAAYSTLDKRGVALMPPPLYAYALFPAVAVALGPLVLPRRAAAVAEWRRARGAIVAVGVLAPLAYGLVLLALSVAPVSSVAAAREVSVVIAAALGAYLLHEPYGRGRLLGSAIIAAGLALLVRG
jgi:drug/metabolite transporter (DMT)-like permease